MIFLSAQPDAFYFSWQLELQLFQFNRLGIPKEKIHVLIGYDPKIGLSLIFSGLMKTNENNGSFFPYPDKRTNTCYLSSLRPHIIKQHLEAYPELQQEAIFYHDSDIIFREEPAWNDLLSNNTWYVADTRHYLDSRYIRKKGGDHLFSQMCNLADIKEEKVIAGDEHCGGAQYLLKNTTPAFWEKIEQLSNAIYAYLLNENDIHAERLLAEGNRKKEYTGFNPWWADMWAIYWQALKENKTVRISDELDFCWATEDISEWERKKTLHYTGAVKDGDHRYFKKINYDRFPPYFDNNIKKIDPGNCSYPLLQLIQAYRAQHDATQRIPLRNTTFLMTVNTDAPARLKNLMTVIQYLDYYLDTTIIIAAATAVPAIDTTILPASCQYFLIENSSPEDINNFLLHQSNTPVIAFYDTDTIINIPQIIRAEQLILAEETDIVIPHDGEHLNVDIIFKNLFKNFPDPQLLLLNKRKFITMEDSGREVIFINKEKWMAAKRITDWAREAQLLRHPEYAISRVNGPCFHLDHRL